MTIVFKCGHAAIDVKRDVSDPPQCPECGERVVARVKNATPVFKGSCSGPLVKR